MWQVSANTYNTLPGTSHLIIVISSSIFATYTYVQYCMYKQMSGILYVYTVSIYKYSVQSKNDPLTRSLTAGDDEGCRSYILIDQQDWQSQSRES